MPHGKTTKVAPVMSDTYLSDEMMLVDAEMIDTDNAMGFEGRMRANACMVEGCSGRKPIDTLYENTSMDTVENPREGSTPAPMSVNPMMYPHRRL
jgi:hypothetical protein